MNLLPALEDGTDRGFRYVGRTQTDAGDIPKRTHTMNGIIFKTSFIISVIHNPQNSLIWIECAMLVFMFLLKCFVNHNGPNA